jgi:CheY-like chemotaxis protein
MATGAVKTFSALKNQPRVMRPTTSPGTTLPTAPTAGSRRQGVAKCDLSGHETVLLVSHEPLSRRATVQVLKEFGYDVLEASTTVEAQALSCTTTKIDLLLTEYSQLENDGLSLVRWCQDRRPRMKALVATDSVWELLQMAGNHERFAVLARPFSKTELGRLLRQILG